MDLKTVLIVVAVLLVLYLILNFVFGSKKRTPHNIPRTPPLKSLTKEAEEAVRNVPYLPENEDWEPGTIGKAEEVHGDNAETKLFRTSKWGVGMFFRKRR